MMSSTVWLRTMAEKKVMMPITTIAPNKGCDEDSQETADAAKEGEGHADDQGARTGNYQEYQGAVEP